MVRLFRLASTNRQPAIFTLYDLAEGHGRQCVRDVGNVDLVVERALEPVHVADDVRVRLHRPLTELGEHGLDRLVLILELLGDLAQRVQGLRGAVDELGDLLGGVLARRFGEVRNRDFLVQRPDQILDLGDGVVVCLVRFPIERHPEPGHVTDRMCVFRRCCRANVGPQRLQRPVQALDVAGLVLVVLVGLVVKLGLQPVDVSDFVRVLGWRLRSNFLAERIQGRT